MVESRFGHYSEYLETFYAARRAYSLRTLQLLARWTVFTEPLGDVIYLSSGRLKGCVFCVARDGTIAVVAVDGYQL